MKKAEFVVKKSLLTVCLITYNHAPYLRQALESVLSQEADFDWDVVIADDYSTDGTREIIQEYKDRYPDKIHLILQEHNVGAEQNWHDLVEYPKSKYIAYLEGDDFWTSNQKLQMQVNFLEAHPDYALCFHPTSVFYENHEERSAIWPKLGPDAKFTVAELLKENFIPSNAAVYRRQKYDLPKGIMPGDWYFHLFHAQFGKIGYIGTPMSAYRRHAGGMWWDSHKNQAAFWDKYGMGTLKLYAELLKMYGDKKEYRQIISMAAATTLGHLAEVDERSDKKLLHQAMQMLPEITEVGVAAYQHKQRQMTEELAAKNDEIEKLTQEVLELRTATFNLRDELHSLKNARLLGKIISARNAVGTARKKVASAPHQVRVVVAPLFPAASRKAIKGIYKKTRGLVNSEYSTRPSKVELVENPVLEKNAPLVSVVIPYYNRADTIDETLDSLKTQSFNNFEVLLVNDGSTDEESVRKLQQLKLDKLKFRIINQENQGVAAARNTGIGEATGKYIVCLDSDDIIEPTFIEKCTLALEADADAALVTAHMQMFGVRSELFQHLAYDPVRLYRDNMVITAAEFRKVAWEKSGGYKSNIGYEDWEFWMNLAEHGFWGKLLPEVLFRYRAALQSRYVDDKDIHWNNIKTIHSLHAEYKTKVKQLLAQRRGMKHVSTAATALINMKQAEHYSRQDNHRRNVLIAIPWMTFGGAETLVLNFCRELKDEYNLSFVTGLKSEHEWEYKFRELTSYIYHLPELFDNPDTYIEFISNYIETRQIGIVHMVHTNIMFGMLEELRRRHPQVKFLLTMFNDRVPEYFGPSIKLHNLIDMYSTDNMATASHYKQELPAEKPVQVIPNGVDCKQVFNPELYDRAKQRELLGIGQDDLAVFFIGRLSEEKNPNVFVETAQKVQAVTSMYNVKFFMVGDGKMRLKIEKQIKDANLKNFTDLGYHSDIPPLLVAADILVLPSAIEGFPLTILEAMAMNVAVIASDVGAVSDVLETGVDGFVVTPGSAEEIERIVQKLSQDPKLLATVQKRAKAKLLEKYSSDALRVNYSKLYKGEPK